MLRQCTTSILCRFLIILQAEIAVHEINGILRLFAFVFDLLLQKAQIACQLFLDDAARIARMIDLQLPNDLHRQAPIYEPRMAQRLMNFPHIAQPRKPTENPGLAFRLDEAVMIILIEIDPLRNDSHDFLVCLIFANDGPHLGQRFWREILVRVEEQDPVTVRLLYREILSR